MRSAAAVVVTVAVALLVTALEPVANAADAERGRALYENHCTVCHTPKVHTRPNRLPLNLEELRQIVAHWAKEENLRWGQDEINDVVWYLNQTKYKY